MKYSVLIVMLGLAVFLAADSVGSGQAGAPASSSQSSPQAAFSAHSSQPASQGAAQASPSAAALTPAQSIPAVDLANARKARALLELAIEALGGQAFLNVHDISEQGRSYSFFHGRPNSNGVLFWRFVQYPDKERIEVTPERDVAYLYTGNKGYELTYKGPRPVETKDLEDYLRRRKFSLETLLKYWVNDSSVALFYDGNALAGNVAAEQVTLINAKDEAVDLFLDLDTHLPLKKSYSWRDPVDRQRDVEEELYDNYRVVQGVNTPYGFTRFFNGDMQSERFVHEVHYNQGLDQAMFDPNSGYKPNKPEKKK
jgi:hypothetical protein